MGRSHRRQLWLPAVAALSLLGLPVAGSYAAGDCSPNGTALSITAFDQKYDKDCLAAPADQPLTVDFKNFDRNIPHNLAIYEDSTAAKALFKGELVDGPGTTTYSVPGLPEGTFVFRCDPHPDTMNGSFIVSGA